MPMNPEVKTEWLEALRSGEYKQGRGQLCRKTDSGTELCCLGVLSEIATKHGIVNRVYTNEMASAGRGSTISYATPDGSALNESAYLPNVVVQWAGLEDINPKVGVPIKSATNPAVVGTLISSTLASQNDEGATFLEIAELIEHQL